MTDKNTLIKIAAGLCLSILYASYITLAAIVLVFILSVIYAPWLTPVLVLGLAMLFWRSGHTYLARASQNRYLRKRFRL
jgi:ABC-type transport system involved in cytochrome c biogenesis permease subunit